MSKILWTAATALLLATMRISAHHAFAAEYDEKNVITVTGVVTSFKMDQSARLAVHRRKGCKRQGRQLGL
jgi:hypothetical protein